MEAPVKTRTEQILKVMHIVAWVALIGFAIETGSILISFAVSCFNPESAKNLYKGLNMYDLRQFSFWHYCLRVTFMVAVLALKVNVWQMVIAVISKINLASPFNSEVAGTLEKISYLLLGTWAVALLSSAHSAWLVNLTGEQYGYEVSGESIFVAGLVFIIAQIFKRGVEIQSENDLTV